MPDYTGEKPKYQTVWAQSPSELPNVGDKCPKCQLGTISEGKWGGVLCFECKTVWKMSKYTDNKPHIDKVSTHQHSEKVEKLLEEIVEETKKLREIVEERSINL